MEQWNSRYAFMTDEQIAEGKRKQQAAHDRLISAIPPAVTKEYQHGYDAGFEVGSKIAHKQEQQEFLDKTYLAVLPVVAACAKRGLMYSEICFEAASAAHEALKHRPMVEDGE